MVHGTPPTALFVHGSWHTPEHFKLVRALFDSKGIPNACPRQACVGKLPPIGLMEDAQVIRDELKRLIEVEHKDVVVMCHSYGGVVSTQGCDKDFGKKYREEKGLPGGVIEMVYMCAFMLPKDVGIAGAFDNKLPPFIVPQEPGLCFVPEARNVFYNDMTKEQQDEYFSELLPCPMDTQYVAITQTAYVYHPITYLFCENDAAMPLFVQKMMVENAEKDTGITIKKETCTAGHSPFISQPERVLEVYRKVIG